MRKNLGSQPALFPMPVLMVATYGEDGKVNVMNVAWGGICAMDRIALNLAPDRKTLQNIQAKKAFTVSLADEAHMAEADFFGIATGNKMDDKFERSGLHAVKSEHVDAPIIEEFPLACECKLIEVQDAAGEKRVVGQIVNVSADESVLDDNGKVNPKKLNALMFDQFQNGYYKVGDKAGQAWNAGAGLMKK